MPPRRVPRVGVVLRLAAGEWLYLDRALILRVTRVREDLSRWYEGAWVWCEGDELDEAGAVVGPIQALVAVDAIPDEAARQ